MTHEPISSNYRAQLDDVVVLMFPVHRDHRGSFREAFRSTLFHSETGLQPAWHQDNFSTSMSGVLRGIHYQLAPSQGKLVSCPVGTVFDVAVDLRRSSPNFGLWTATYLSGDNGKSVWVPEGFGHGFYVVEGPALVHYKTTREHDPAGYRSLRWDDPTIAIDWPFDAPPIVSERDSEALLLDDAELPK